MIPRRVIDTATIMATIAARLDDTRARLRQACAAHGRAPDSVALLAVSKTFPAEALAQAHAAGQRAFGENYVQEGVDKIAACRALGLIDLQWHCIGPVQSNKTRLVAEHFDWIHSVDEFKTARRLSDQRAADAAPLNICLQVNLDGEASKSGVAPVELTALALMVAKLPRLRLRGLMSIPAPRQGQAAQREPHRRLHQLFDACRAALAPEHADVAASFDTLSMGMSDDLEAAVAEGSTLVRVGRGIFGDRAHA